MSAASNRNPFEVLEIFLLIFGHVDDPSDLLNCACVSRTWSMLALERLYRGSMNDMRYRTPEIGSLNSLWVASPERFARNMCFVKHLVVAPETPALDENFDHINRFACVERCRPLRDRRSAKLLLRPREKGPVSLAIPFEILDQDLSTLFDLILHPGLKFLTIDHIYCELLSPVSPPRNPWFPLEVLLGQEKLSNLAALSIHRSKSRLRIDKICKCLEHCNLELFQIDERQELDDLSRSEMVQLLRSLRQRRNLQALALMMHCYETNTGEIYADLEKEEGTLFWPRLRALYLAVVDRHWLEKLPMFQELQILRLRKLVSSLPDIAPDAARSISQCQHLRVIDVEFPKANDPGILHIMARGCPLLQSFRVNCYFRKEMTEDQFSRLSQALPHVELLSLDIRFQMTGSKLRDLANSCPRLTMLKLFRTRLRLSVESLAEVSPFQRLGLMYLGEVWFEIPIGTCG